MASNTSDVEAAMRLQFLGKTGNSGSGDCPALYRTDRGTYVVQGKIVTDPDALGRVRSIMNEIGRVEPVASR
ncbi:hypothetical protein [Nonomuraea dietziae]|uniref:hypothetical protein n=1 Tax=Nonomuraea dietziae TaxID=65515 RepID=UPI0033E9A7C7